MLHLVLVILRQEILELLITSYKTHDLRNETRVVTGRKRPDNKTLSTFPSLTSHLFNRLLGFMLQVLS